MYEHGRRGARMKQNRIPRDLLQQILARELVDGNMLAIFQRRKAAALLCGYFMCSEGLAR